MTLSVISNMSSDEKRRSYVIVLDRKPKPVRTATFSSTSDIVESKKNGVRGQAPLLRSDPNTSELDAQPETISLQWGPAKASEEPFSAFPKQGHLRCSGLRVRRRLKRLAAYLKKRYCAPRLFLLKTTASASSYATRNRGS